jgi:large subunit ribosomal protein L13
MPTFSAKPHEVRRDWYLVDASNRVLGRLAAEIARRLRGKHKPEFTPHVDTGDYVVVVNAGKLRVTGNKGEGKTYYRHSTYPGGVYATTFAKMQARFPTRALEIAVKGMLAGPLATHVQEAEGVCGRRHRTMLSRPKTLRSTRIGQVLLRTGRRKRSRTGIHQTRQGVCRNDRPANQYFARETGQMVVRQPLVLTDMLTQFDVMVNVTGEANSGERARCATALRAP